MQSAAKTRAGARYAARLPQHATTDPSQSCWRSSRVAEAGLDKRTNQGLLFVAVMGTLSANARIGAGPHLEHERTRTTVHPFIRMSLSMLVLVAVPLPAEAFEVSGGVSLGGIVAGTVPRLAVSPHASLAWRMESGFLLAAHDLLSILPSINKDGAGVSNQTSVALGYAWEKGDFSVGPSLSIYSMPACGVTLCGRVAGLSPGGHGQATVYFAGSWGGVGERQCWLGRWEELCASRRRHSNPQRSEWWARS